MALEQGVVLPTKPEQSGIMPDAFDPGSMDDMMMDREEDTTPQQPDPMAQKVMVADASGQVPLPARAPEMGTPDAQAPGTPPPVPTKSPFDLVPKNDSRYQDPQNLLVADVFLGGLLPWLQAGADLAAGRITADEFDATRQEHQYRIQDLRNQHAPFVSAAEKAMPFISGVLGGAGIGGVARGVGIATGQGAAQGYTSGPVEEPSLSGNRAGAAVGGAVTAGGIAAMGAGAARGVMKGVGAVQGRMAQKAEEAAKQTAETAAASKARLETQKQTQAERAKQQDEQRVTEFPQYNAMPKKFSKHFEENRRSFAKDPVGMFKFMADQHPTVEGMASALKMPPSVIVQRMIPKLGDITPRTVGEKHLYDDIRRVYEARDAYIRSGKAAPEPKVPGEGKAKTNAKTKPPFTESQFRSFQKSPAGKRSKQEIEANTRKQQLDADAEELKRRYNPGPVPRGGKNPKPLKLKE